MKPCKKCLIEKEPKFFGISKRSADGLNIYCKDCCNVKSREFRKKNYVGGGTKGFQPINITNPNKKWF